MSELICNAPFADCCRNHPDIAGIIQWHSVTTGPGDIYMPVMNTGSHWSLLSVTTLPFHW